MIEVSGHQVFIDEQDLPVFHSKGWYVRNARSANGERFYLHDGDGRPFHRVIMNPPAHMDVDHKNRNGLDNRRQNLRICTHSQNRANSAKLKRASSAFKGVALHRSSRVHPWAAYICRDYTTYRLGHFHTEIAAAYAYDVAAFILFGEFARPNFSFSREWFDHFGPDKWVVESINRVTPDFFCPQLTSEKILPNEAEESSPDKEGFLDMKALRRLWASHGLVPTNKQ